MAHASEYPDPSLTSQTPYPAISSQRDKPSIRGVDDDFDSRRNGPLSLNELLTKHTTNASQFYAQNSFDGASSSYLWPGSRVNDETRDLLEVEPEPEPVLEGQLLSHHLLNKQPVVSSDEDDSSDEDIAIDASSATDTRNAASNVEVLASARGRGRGRGRGRSRGRVRGSSGRRGGYRQLLKGTEHENVGRKVKVKEIDRRSGPRAPRPRKVPDPGPEFKDLMGRAMSTRLDGKLEDAMGLARSAILANPEVFQAHFLLSEILTGLSRHVDSLIVYVNGCNTTRDPDAWLSAGHRAWDFANSEPERYSYLQLAKFCFDKCVKYRFSDLVARGRRLDYWLELGPEHKARKEAKGLAREDPYNLDYVRLYAELCTRSGDKVEIDKAKIVYERAFDHYYAEYTQFPQPDESWSFLHIYLELAEHTGRVTWADSIKRLKRYARWFLGRKDEVFWEDWDDDREFDSDPGRRGQRVPEFQQGRASLDRMCYGEGLPLEIRAKYLFLRLNMGFGWNEEVERHVDELLRFPSEEVNDFADVYLAVANKLVSHRYFDYAIKISKLLLALPGQADDELFLGLGHCYRNTNRLDESEKYYKIVIDKQPNNIRARVELAKLYEASQRQAEALELVQEVLRLSNRETILRNNLPMPRPATRLTPAMSGEESEPADTPDSCSSPDAGIAMATAKRVSKQSTVKTRGKKRKERGTKRMPLRREESVRLPSELSTNTYQRIAPRPDGSIVLPANAHHAKRRSKQKGPLEVDTSIRRRKQRLIAPLHPNHAATQARIRRMQDEASMIKAKFEVVQELWPVVEQGEDESAIRMWSEEARGMVEAFMSMDVFYPQRDKNMPFRGYSTRGNQGGQSTRLVSEMQAMKNRLKDSIYIEEGEENEDDDEGPGAPPINAPKDFHGIAFPDWHRIFVDLILLYAHKLADKESCYAVANGVRNANVFVHDPALNNVSMAVSFCIAFVFNDSRLANDCARTYIVDSQFRSGNAYQLMAAVSRLCYGNNQFATGPTQKFMLRSMKQHDYALMEPEVRDKIDFSNQTRGLRNKLAALAREKQPEFLPGLLLHYGHQTSDSTQSFTSLNYFHRVLALQPENISVHLSIATTFIHNAMKRQTNNRHYGVQQGLAFLYRYYDLRVADGSMAYLQEAEFNVARTWHMLGLTNLAIPGYEKVLELSPLVRKEVEDRHGAVDGLVVEEDGAVDSVETEDFAAEAAFALQGVFALAGNHHAARAITERWLVM